MRPTMPDLPEKVITLYQKGYSLSKLAKLYKTSEHFIRNYLLNNRIVLRNPGNTYNLNHPWRVGYGRKNKETAKDD